MHSPQILRHAENHRDVQILDVMFLRGDPGVTQGPPVPCIVHIGVNLRVCVISPGGATSLVEVVFTLLTRGRFF